MNKPLVLVVEDDTPVRNLITTTLKPMNTGIFQHKTVRVL